MRRLGFWNTKNRALAFSLFTCLRLKSKKSRAMERDGKKEGPADSKPNLDGRKVRKIPGGVHPNGYQSR
jgi:hypothetical protein